MIWAYLNSETEIPEKILHFVLRANDAASRRHTPHRVLLENRLVTHNILKQ